MENFFFPNSGNYSRHPFFPDNEVYSRRPFFSDSVPFFPDSGTYSHHPFFPDTGGSFFPDTGIYPRRPFADDEHQSTKPNWSAPKHQSDFADSDRPRSRYDTSVPVHYANDKPRSATKHQSDFADNDRSRSSYDTSVPVHYANEGFADHKHRSADDNSVPIHYAGNKHRSDFTDHKHANKNANDNHRSDYADHDRSAAAIKIQKIVRGFLVKKDMRTVRKITVEMAEIGHQISALKFCDNAKQRLWIGEMLMALLLRLDAVRGVREYRKKVVRRVIQFQEAVDSIAQDRSVETADSAEITGAIEENTTIEEAVEDGGEIACREINMESFGVGLSFEDSREKSLHMAEVTPSERAEESIAVKEAIERAAVAENEAMKKMVEELCERSQQQCDLLTSLVRRLEHLECRVQDMEMREKETKIY